MVSISYIIPTYNSLSLLKRCLQSLESQLDINDKIIIVDDGSTDGTYEYLKEKILLNSNIVVLRQENSGSGPARNNGLENCHTTYVWFIDADDFLFEGASKIIKKTLMENSYDILYFDYIEKRKDQDKTVSLKIDVKNFTTLLFSKHYPWNKVIKRSLFKNINFPNENIRFQDHATIPRVLIRAKNIGYINKPLYYHDISHDGNITKNSNRLDDLYRACDYLLNNDVLELLVVKTFVFDRLYMIADKQIIDIYKDLVKIKGYLNKSIPNWKKSSLFKIKYSGKYKYLIKYYKIKVLIAKLFKYSTLATFLILVPLFGIRKLFNKK